MKLCFATSNQNKIREIQAKLGDQFEIISLGTLGCQEEIPETTGTFAGNSLQKAQYVWDHYQVNCFADDSGLEVEALNGEPGVDSAFYSGSRDFDKNIEKLLKNLGDTSHRKARFITIITLIIDGKAQQFTGTAEGNILYEKKGIEGFGYDPVFVPDGFEQTFAEMSLEAKNRISHRSKAFQQLIDYLSNL